MSTVSAIKDPLYRTKQKLTIHVHCKCNKRTLEIVANKG